MGTRIALDALGPLIALRTFRTLRSGGAHWASGTVSSGITSETLRTNGACGAGWSFRSSWSRRALWTSWTLGTHCTFGARWTSGALKSCVSLDTLRA